MSAQGSDHLTARVINAMLQVLEYWFVPPVRGDACQRIGLLSLSDARGANDGGRRAQPSRAQFLPPCCPELAIASVLPGYVGTRFARAWPSPAGAPLAR